MKLLLTCEHARNDIPPGWEDLFKDAGDIISSHRGWDPGAEEVFDNLKASADTSFLYPWTRLLIEINRSLHHPKLFSEFTHQLTKAQKSTLINKYYLPYRNEVTSTINNWITINEKVIHISVHSFTPALNGKDRNTDLAFLYDPKRDGEKEIAKNWKKELLTLAPSLRIRFNYPYFGKSDGLTTALRRKFGERYAGLEIEMCQDYYFKNKLSVIMPVITNSFQSMINSID